MRSLTLHLVQCSIPEMSGRNSLPHDPPPWIDPSRHVWFVTVNALPRGTSALTVQATATAILESVAFRYQRQQWYPWLFSVMPDHCHVLLSFSKEVRSLKKSISDWKHWLAAKHNIHWQRDFFDHRLREDESFSEKSEYIWMNPVVEGLVREPGEWPWVWTPPDATPFTGWDSQ